MILSADYIKEKAKELGFSACGMSQAMPVNDDDVNYLDRWLANGCQGGMQYMENHRDIRINPDGLVPGARSVISVALNYYPQKRRDPAEPHIAFYAYGKDYHIVVKEKLRKLWEACMETLSDEEGNVQYEARCFTDSAPILERYWAWKSGLGWIGKNTNLIIPGQGSFFFLGEIVTTAPIDKYDSPKPNRCGTCRRCLDACPTHALEAPRQLNASKCLSYLTIEHKGELPPEAAAQLGNRLYGCDTCQLACPWNRMAQPTLVEEFAPTDNLLGLKKESLIHLTKEKYNCIFAKSAVKRAKYEGLMRTINHLNKS